jgi:hypothetical protein
MKLGPFIFIAVMLAIFIYTFFHGKDNDKNN